MPAAVKSLPNGTFIVAGKGALTMADPYDGLVTLVSGSGDIIWSFLIGGTGHDEFTGVTPLSDGGFLLYGFTCSFGYPEGKAWLVRIDNTGSLIWSRQLGGSSTGADRVKAVQQFSDGDIIGTFNANDGTASGNPIVFKMGLDGTLRWAQTFDHGQNDSFTSIAFSGNVIYASGFYSITTRRAVIVKLNSSDGSLIASTNIYKRDATYEHEIVGLEVRNNIISYGLWMYERRNFPNFNYNSIILVQTDLADNNLFTVYTDNGGDSLALNPLRTPDNGFLVSSLARGNNGPPFVVKMGPYGYNEWGNLLAQYYYLDTRHAVDVTADGGCIAAGYYKPYNSPTTMSIMRINANGENGSCKFGTRGLHPDTTSYSRQPFSWQQQTAIIPAVNEVVVPALVSISQTRTTLCETSLCTDNTPLPPACNKTYNLQFAAVKPVMIRDAVTTTDGGKLVVGDQRFNGLAIKYNQNGDVAWSKQYETYFHESKFMRVIRTPDNNYLIFANRFITLNHGSSTYVSMIKVDINGNVLWVRNINERGGGTVADVAMTPDGGFVLVVNANYNSYAVRYDVNLNVLWKKQFIGVFNPSYKTVYCSNGAAYLQYQNPFNTSTTSFGIEKLDLATGNRIWSNIYTAGGPNSSVLFNRVFAINDTAYVFVTHKVPINSFDAVYSPVMVKINPNGTVAQSVQFQGDNAPPWPFYTSNYDMNPPTVAITPYNDFVLTTRVVAGTDTLLRLARIGTDGTVGWSGVYNNTKQYYPFNIHTQGKGIVIMGAVRNRYLDPSYYSAFTDAFVIKTDSSGQLLTGGAPGCTRTDRLLVPTPLYFSVSPTGHFLQDEQYLSSDFCKKETD